MADQSEPKNIFPNGMLICMRIASGPAGPVAYVSACYHCHQAIAITKASRDTARNAGIQHHICMQCFLELLPLCDGPEAAYATKFMPFSEAQIEEIVSYLRAQKEAP